MRDYPQRAGLHLLLSFCLSFVAFGCSPGNVTVEAKSAMPSVAAGHPNSTGFGEGLPQKSSSTEQIYFKRVLVDHGSIQSVVAVSFASPESKTKVPFGYPLRLRQDLGVNPVFSLGSHQLAYLRRNDENGATLMSRTETETEPQILTEFSAPIAGFSLNRELGQVAWIDRQGKIRVARISSKIAVTDGKTIELPEIEDRANSIEWNPWGSQLLVRTEKGSALLYSQEVLTQPSSELKLPSAPAYDLTWSGQNRISYWTSLKTEGKEKAENRTLDLLTGQESVSSAFDINADGNGIVCPVWVGDTLYFGNYQNGMYLIERVQHSGGQNEIREIFAMPPASDEGFICPTMERPADS